MSDIDRIKKFIPIMNEISPTFCMAKWHHTTIYLQTGQTHSCYHPAPHNIQLSEIKNNPSALHNTRQKKLERMEMLDGEKPSGCQYCWNIEDLGEEYISDRKERNSSIYTPERFESIKQNPLADVNPQYIEISFGNECNFKCGYCHPKHSSSYHKEIKDFGPYDMVKNHRNDIDWFTVYEEETNPYVKAWWEWWPEVSKTLTILRITGGEPLLQQSTWRLFEELDKNPLPDLELNINSNLGVKPILVNRLAEKVNDLIKNKKIKKFKLFTSIDTWGPQAEYIRTGLDLKKWEENLDYYLKETKLPVTFMITFNVLTVTNFTSLLKKILEWREKYNESTSDYRQRIRFDTPYLKEPLQYDMNILPKDEFMPYMYNHLEFIKNNIDENDLSKFKQLEYEKFLRVVKYMETTNYSDERLAEGRKDFYNWFTEYDRRRNTDFTSTFPEMTNFYLSCSEDYMNKLLKKSKAFCMLPWVHVHTIPSGKVLPCCIAKDHKGTFGDTTKDSLESVVNSEGMKELRLNMLYDTQDNTCKQCYAHEKSGIRSFRESMNDQYGKHFGETVINTNSDGSLNDFKMRYFDIRFNNICNFKCVTCNSGYSSQWEQENKKYRNMIEIIPKNDDPKLIEDIVKHVDHIDLAYFAGGEPLITDEHYTILEEFIRKNRSDIRLRYNTNLSNFKFKNKDILDLWKYFKNGVEIFASIDHYGERAEYIRHGTDWGKVEENLIMCRSLDYIETHINTVVSAFNYVSLGEFYQYLIDKNLYTKHDPSYTAYNLQGPIEMTSQVLTDKYKKIGGNKIKSMVKSMKNDNWSPDQLTQLTDCISWANSKSTYEDQKDKFKKFVEENDKFRGTDFVKTFPEIIKMIT